MWDSFVEWFLERVYDNVEGRSGRLAAWLTVIVLTFAIVAVGIGILMALKR